MQGAGEGNLLLWSFHSQNLSTSFHHSHQLTVGSHKEQNLTLSFLVRGNWFTQQKGEAKIGCALRLPLHRQAWRGHLAWD